MPCADDLLASERNLSVTASSSAGGSVSNLIDHSWYSMNDNANLFATDDLPNQYIIVTMGGDWLLWQLILYAKPTSKGS